MIRDKKDLDAFTARMTAKATPGDTTKKAPQRADTTRLKENLAGDKVSRQSSIAMRNNVVKEGAAADSADAKFPAFSGGPEFRAAKAERTSRAKSLEKDIAEKSARVAARQDSLSKARKVSSDTPAKSSSKGKSVTIHIHNH